MRGINLDDLDTMSLSDPYFIMYSEGNEIYRSEIIMDDLNPEWKDFSLKVSSIRNTLKINVWDKDSVKDDFIGGCELNLQELLQGEVRIAIHNTKKKGDSQSGELLINARSSPDLVHRIHSGMKIGLALMVSCALEYSGISSVLISLTKCFYSISDIRAAGFGSVHNAGWMMQNVQGIEEIMGDSELNRKRLGPCALARALTGVIRDLDLEKYWIVIVVTAREILDCKTLQQVLKETKGRPISFRFFVPADNTSNMIENTQGLQSFRYTSDTAGECVRKGLAGIAGEIENY